MRAAKKGGGRAGADAATEMLAAAVSRYLARETGIAVTFQTAIVPNWRDNSIRFENVRMSRDAARLGPDLAKLYAQFDITVDVLEVKLSFARLWKGASGGLSAPRRRTRRA